MPQLYRVCKSRKEAEGLTRAIAERLGAMDTIIFTDDDGECTGLAYNVRIIPEAAPGKMRGDVDVILRKSRASGRFQLFIRASNDGHMARVRAALTRRITKRITWPVRAD